MKSENTTAQIKCTSDSSMDLYQSQSIHITNLEFIGCGGNQVRHVKEFMVEDAKFEGQENSGSALKLIETTAQIVNSTFLSNRKGLINECAIQGSDYCQRGFVGGAIIATNSRVDISQSRFEDNRADAGGAIFAERNSMINMSGNGFISNKADFEGGVLYSRSSIITIRVSVFQDNNASFGGVLYFQSSTMTIKASGFHYNSATKWGGVLYLIYSSTITIEASEFYDNNASSGGALASDGSTITIEASKFHGNNATDSGGVLYSTSSNITATDSYFTNNVSPIGAIIYATFRSTIQYNSSLFIHSNKAHRYAVIYLSDSKFIGNYSLYDSIWYTSNLGSLVAFNSNITFTGFTIFVNNQPSQTISGDFQEGGAITLIQSNVFFYGFCHLEHNHAENGGAIHSTESKVYVNEYVTIAHNTATGNGGGVYLSTGELNCQQISIFVLWNNTASHKGGGLHAISSSIKAPSFNNRLHQHILSSSARINITGNAADRGGGLSLEANAKLYNIILKYDYDDTNVVSFTSNSADYGGAIHVDDDTNSGTCASSTETECFFQVLALYSSEFSLINTQSMHFSQNHANISGSTLYGGLLDRCAVSPVAEVHNKYPHAFKDGGGGIAYFKNVSTPTYLSSGNRMEIVIDANLSLSSDPVRVCLCFNADQNNDCTHQHYTEVKKGQTFRLSVVVVDQIGQPVSATIQTFLHFTESGLYS